MANHIEDPSQRQAALTAGFSILVMTVAAVFATDISIGSLVVSGDPAATIGNIRASEILFRAGIFSWIVILICDVTAAWGLYVYLEQVNRGLALLMAWLRLVYAAVLGAAVFNYVRVLPLSGGDGYAAAFGVEQLQAQVMLYLEGFDDTWSIGLVIFGFHILVLGVLALRSGYIPKVFGVLLIAAFLGYLVINLAGLLLPAKETSRKIMEYVFIMPMVVGEVGLGLWLLVKGGKSQKPESRV